jgi:glycosyltransferase involved in cell wall biosynthesis/SAM-dependent methyltransferase
MTQPPPRVSILIPNYNNGRQSSKTGGRDFIGDLFRSLRDTLRDDPTPVEILVADDGSTDDSLATCREWTTKTWGGWRGEQPFCRLFEFQHTGVLSIIANRLTDEARGEICCRLDGDIVILTPAWAGRLCAAFDAGPPELGIIGPKQLGLDGRIHSAGSWILHPRGHHHVAQGAIRETVTRTLEVDHVMGCFYCHKREIWAQLDGYDESFLRGQTVDFGLRARLKGWRAFAVPDIEFIHAHGDRIRRPNEADSNDGIERTLDRFTEKWGFDRLAADLDVVAERYAGTPLLWNARVFGPATPWPVPSAGALDIRQSDWARYAADESYRDAIDARLRLVQHLQKQLSPRRRILHVRSRSGLLCHLLATTGLECVGVDPDPNFVDLAQNACAEQNYPGPAPEFIVQQVPRRLPVEDGSFDTVLLFDIFETHPNPVSLLKEARRVTGDNGAVAIVTRQRNAPFDADYDTLHAYRPHELVLQVLGSRCFEPVAVEGFGGIAGALTLFGRRRSGSHPTFHPPKPERAGAGVEVSPELVSA